MEHRQSTRIPFTAPAFVVQGSRSFSSTVRDISRHGLFVATPADSKPGDSALVAITLRHAGRSLSLTIPCSVARVSEIGLGCTSVHLDPETLLFCSNLLHESASGPAEFLQTFYSYLDGRLLEAAEPTALDR